MARAGKIEIEVRQPYPAWCDLFYEGKRLVTLHHKELSDLHYAVGRAMQDARLILGRDANEV